MHCKMNQGNHVVFINRGIFCSRLEVILKDQITGPGCSYNSPGVKFLQTPLPAQPNTHFKQKNTVERDAGWTAELQAQQNSLGLVFVLSKGSAFSTIFSSPLYAVFLSSTSLKIFPLEKSCTDCSYPSSHRLSNLFWVFVLFCFFFFLGFTAMSSLKVPQAVPFSTRKQKIILNFNVFYQEVHALSGCLAEQKFSSKHKLLPAFWPFIIFDIRPCTGV